MPDSKGTIQKALEGIKNAKELSSSTRCQNCDMEVNVSGALPDGAFTADGKGPYCWGCLDEAQAVEDRNAIEA